MAKRTKISKLKRLLDYDPETGEIKWKEDSPINCKNAHAAGEIAGTINWAGYWAINIEYMPQLAHRIVWALMKGRWPRHQIDHINRIKTDNRWCNLRAATNSQNTMNRGAQSNNKLGIKGVSAHKFGGFFSRINKDGKGYYLGYFATAAEAKQAYDEAAVRLHQEFHRTA